MDTAVVHEVFHISQSVRDIKFCISLREIYIFYHEMSFSMVLCFFKKLTI